MGTLEHIAHLSPTHIPSLTNLHDFIPKTGIEASL
jgi:hypothetical protein